MKETAVEWLIDEAMKLVVQYMQGTLNEDTLDDVIYKIGTKAKEMEKEQMQMTWNNAIDAVQQDKWESYDDFYNNNFKAE